MNINESQLIEAMNRADMILRPTVVFIHPENLEILKQEDPDIESKMVFHISELIEKNKCIVMKREDFEKMLKSYYPEIKPFEL